MANTKTRKRFKGYSIFEGETEKEYQRRLKRHRQFAGKDATLKRRDKIGVAGALGRVASDIIGTAAEHPLETGAVIYTGGTAIGAVGAKQYVKKKSAKLIKKVKEKLGGKYVRKDKTFKGTKDKGARQRAEEQKTKFEKVRTRTVEDLRFKKGNVKRKKTEAYYEPSGRAVLEGLKKPAGLTASGIIGYKALTGGETTVGGATYEDKTTGSNLQKSKKKRELEGRSMLKSSANKPNGKVTMTSTIVKNGQTNWATGKPRNNISTVSAKSINNKPYKSVQDGGKRQDWVGDDHRQNAYKTGGSNKTSTSVASNYTRTKDHRGTRVEKDTRRANVSGTNARLQRNGASKTKKTTKKKLHGSEIFRRRLGGMRGY